MRLFVALAVPAEASAALDGALARHRAAIPGRWISPADRHVTLRFLGELGEDRVLEVTAAIETAARAGDAFPLALAPLGTFPARGRARVLWAGLDDPHDALGPLVTRLANALGPVVPPEGRPFAAHLTVARFDPPRRLPDDEPPPDWEGRLDSLVQAYRVRPAEPVVRSSSEVLYVVDRTRSRRAARSFSPPTWSMMLKVAIS